MTDPLAWPAYPWLWLHDIARCLALAHQDRLHLNARGTLSVSSLQRLASVLALQPAHPAPRSQAQAPRLGFLVGLLGQAGLLGSLERRLQVTATAYDWLALPASLQIDALRQVWWRAPTLDGGWLPATRHQWSLDSHRRQVIGDVCDWVTRLPLDGWTPSQAVEAYLADRDVLRVGGKMGNLPRVHQAQVRRALALAGLLLDFILPVLGLVEPDTAGPDRRVRPTPDGQAWLRAALERARRESEPPGDAALELLVPGPPPAFPEPAGAPVRVEDDLTVQVDPAAPIAFTFELAHFADWLTPGPPARYRLTPASLERALALGFDLSEIRFLLARFAGAPLPPAAATQLAEWEGAHACLHYRPGYRLTAAGPGVLAGLSRRPAFRRRATPLPSGAGVWVPGDHAAGLLRYLRRLGYRLLPESQDDAPEMPLPWPAPRRALPLASLLVALRAYRRVRRALPGLAELGLEGLEAALAAALSPEQLAGVERLAASHAALLDARLEPTGGQAPEAAGAGARQLLDRLRAAIAAGGAVEIGYVDTRARVSRRRVRPLGIETRAGLDYLVAFCELRQEERHFRLDRVVRLE